MVRAPSVRRRLVGKALRRYRENLGYTLSDAARMLDCDTSKISRIETGDRGIRVKELRELLEEYGISAEQQELLGTLADPRGAFGWSSAYADILPAAWHDYLILETEAANISGYEAQRVPGLLQTRDYARALAETDPFLKDNAAREQAADAVVARQKAILFGARRAEIHLVLGEAALHQQVGSAQVMSDQLLSLARVAGGTGSATVQVLPFESGAHAAVGDGSLAILQVTDAPRLGLVHVGGIGGGVCLEGPRDLEVYAEALDQLRAFAHSPVQSALLLRGLAGD
jgi:transcriptional regulator with XRE-family HTH domain